ncbi:hypothetical protein GCM10009825_18300 [Arthrobacter humicola]|uniref:Uncharacterized protein n=1 Tax=Arthrobacter humicola TaxID=409291 RepID=A0ABN2YZR0_9MICC
MANLSYGTRAQPLTWRYSPRPGAVMPTSMHFPEKFSHSVGTLGMSRRDPIRRDTNARQLPNAKQRTEALQNAASGALDFSREGIGISIRFGPFQGCDKVSFAGECL